MTFAARTLQGLAVGLSIAGAVVQDIFGNAACSASITFNTNGTCTYVGNSCSGPSNWWTAGGSPGNSVWIKFTQSSGVGPNNGGLSALTVYALSSARTLGWSCAASAARQGQVTVSFYSDSGATQLIGTASINALADGT